MSVAEPYPAWFARTLPAHYTVPAHIEYLCDQVQRLVTGEIQRLCISTPPGHSKSETVTRRLPAYWARLHPRDVIVQTGYSQRFTEKHLSYPTREIAREAGVLASNATALDEWEFSNGARLVARGVGSAPTGVNPISLLVCDDPIKDRAQAQSEVERENVWQWWTGSIVQRFWPRTRAVVIATRWHENDLIGRLKEQDDPANGGPGEWTFINLPALAEEDDPLGREVGEALWPEAKPAAFLRKLRGEMGAYDFEALFQGNPTPREGSTFKVSKLSYIDAADVPARSDGLRLCRAWDLAATEGGGDYTAGVLLGRDAEGFTYVLDVVRGQWDASERNARLVETAQRDGVGRPHSPAPRSGAGREGAGAEPHPAPLRLHRQDRARYGSKEVRADPFAAQVNGGNVRLVRAVWNAAYVEEHRAFPAGAHDDTVDAEADAFAEINAKTLSAADLPAVSHPW